MRISKEVWDKYVEDLRKINDTAAKKIKEFFEGRTWANYSGPLTDQNYQALIDYCFAITTKYGEAASELTALIYDAVAATEKKAVEAAFPAKTASYDEVRKTVIGTMETTENADAFAASVSRLVKMAGVDTTMQNALRDGAEWAWIPHGMTCAFCILLASQGWVPASKNAIKGGHAEHIHANCDCTYAVRFDTSSEVAGYRPEEYREIYDNADGRTGRQKLNSMRREFYARNKEVINEQKRDAYAKRAERESSAAEEMNA